MVNQTAQEDVLEMPKGWKEEKFTAEDNPHGLLAESSFSCLYPAYREKYIREAWPAVQQSLKEYNVIGELDAVKGQLTVKTTRKTWDPFIIVKARDLIKLLARSVPAEQALRILDDDVASDIIKVGGMVRKKDRFVRRRQRLVGNNGTTLKALEILTKCFVLVQGTTVSAIGPHRGLKEVRKFVEETMTNVHPVYNIKKLMLKRELEKRPELRTESWDRFFPDFKKKTVSKRSKPKKQKTKKEYTPFPPQQPPSKVDKELESGEYFLKETERSVKKVAKKREKQQQKLEVSAQKRASAFVAPDEAQVDKKKLKLRQKATEGKSALPTSGKANSANIQKGQKRRKSR